MSLRQFLTTIVDKNKNKLTSGELEMMSNRVLENSKNKVRLSCS